MKMLLFIWTACALCTFSDEPITLQTYPVDFADPEEIAAVAPLMMPSTNDLSVGVVERKLVVRGTAEQHAVIKQMIRDLDSPPKNIQINVNFDTAGSIRQSEFGVRPRGPITISDGHVSGSLAGRLGSRRTTRTENTTQMLVAMDGRSATLRVGERVPYLSWLVEYGYRHGYILQTEVEWRDVGSFLAVEPTIVAPGIIRVRVIPELSGRLKDGTRREIQFTHLATEVTVADGQPVQIGGFSEDEGFSSKFMIGRGSGGESRNTVITLTPKILQ